MSDRVTIISDHEMEWTTLLEADRPLGKHPSVINIERNAWILLVKLTLDDPNRGDRVDIADTCHELIANVSNNVRLFGWCHLSIDGDVQCGSAASPAADAATVGIWWHTSCCYPWYLCRSWHWSFRWFWCCLCCPLLLLLLQLLLLLVKSTMLLAPVPVAGVPLLYHLHSSSHPCA